MELLYLFKRIDSLAVHGSVHHSIHYLEIILISYDSDWQPQTYVKPEAKNTVFELLMMSDVSLETC